MIQDASELGKPRFARRQSFVIMTGMLFLASWIGHFGFELIVEQNDAEQHSLLFQWSEFWPQFLASTLENWQSEFLQLMWQAVGLALFLSWGSSQSKETDERVEAKIDALCHKHGISPETISELVNRDA